MKEYHYYTCESHEDLIYEMPMYFDIGVEMSTTTFNLMFGRPTLGRPSVIRLERINEEDILIMKQYKDFKDYLVKIPYPNVLNNLVVNGNYKMDEANYFYVE